MIVLDEAPESPSKVRANRPACALPSRQLPLNQRASLRTVDNLAQRGVPGDGMLTPRHANLPKTASNDPAITQIRSISVLDEKPSTLAHRSKIVSAGLVVLATGALASITLTAIQTGDSSRSAVETTNNTQSAATQQALQEIPIEPVLRPPSIEAEPARAADTHATDTLSASSATDVIVEELTETRRLANVYLEEIDWLHSHNDFLQQTIDDLDSETTALNYELLQLELKVSALETEAKQRVEKRTVYNFVNVPIGSASE